MPSRLRLRGSLALAALSVGVGWSASAQPSLATPEQSVFVPSSAYNLHGPGPESAQGAHREGRVELRAVGRGRVVVTDVGSATENHLNAWGFHEETSSWDHRWTGRMTRRGDTLTITLHVAATSCRTEERDREAASVTGSCDGQRDVTLRCEPTPGRTAWSCAPTAALAGPASMTPWIFVGGRGCLERSGGGMFAPMGDPEPCATP